MGLASPHLYYYQALGILPTMFTADDVHLRRDPLSADARQPVARDHQCRDVTTARRHWRFWSTLTLGALYPLTLAGLFRSAVLGPTLLTCSILLVVTILCLHACVDSLQSRRSTARQPRFFMRVLHVIVALLAVCYIAFHAVYIVAGPNSTRDWATASLTIAYLLLAIAPASISLIALDIEARPCVSRENRRLILGILAGALVAVTVLSVTSWTWRGEY